MSWLYTVIFASLMFSFDGGVASPNTVSAEEAVVVTRAAKDETEKFEQTYPLSANGRINVSNVNGSIMVEAWDRNEVKLEYTKMADTRERLSDVEIRIDARQDSFSVEADYDNLKNKGKWKNGKLTVEFRLMAPRGAVLNEIETVNGSVAVSNFTNMTRISAVNGSVNATNIRGTAKLSTVNGEVSADFDRLETGSRINLETVNGRVSLVIPSDANATVRADSLNGNISNDFGLPVRKGKYVGRDLYGRIGNGDVQIKLESVNGPLSIGRKSDGRTASPATDLLPQKGPDDGDWDNDEEGVFNGAKIDRESAKAIKESVKASVKASADMQKEIEKFHPEIEKLANESAALTGKSIEELAVYMKSDEFKQRIKEAELRQREMAAVIADASFFPSIPRIEKKSASYTVKGTPKITVEAEGASVHIKGWDKSEVQYRVTQMNDPRNKDLINIDESHTESSLTLKVHDQHSNLRRTRIEIFVPRKSNLKIESSGEIRLEGIAGEVDLVGADETINVRDVLGKLRVANSDGRIRVVGFSGELEASTKDGALNLEGDFTRLTANANAGDVTLTLREDVAADLEVNKPELTGAGLELKRVNGDQAMSRYRIGAGGRPYSVHTSGDISLRAARSITESY